MSFGANSLLSDTIVATASSGAISVVKMSGKQAVSIAYAVCKKNYLTPRYAHLTYLYDGERVIDKAIVIFFRSPASFTGEDVIEFQCHGGEALVSIIIELCMRYGARAARAGEFSYRAVLNKKLSIAEAEAASALANAQSKRAVEVLAANLSGKLNEFVSDTRNALLELLAYSETSIDYATEDLPIDLLFALKIKLSATIEIVRQSLEASKARQGLFDGFRVDLIGKPNVGKSSLLNSLLSYERAIVSEIAGTTRDTIEEWIHIGPFKAKLIDTAGIRNTNDKIEACGVSLSLRALDEANIVVALFDSSSDFDDKDNKILELISKTNNKIVIIALTKADLEQKLSPLNFANFNVVRVSKYTQNEQLLNQILVELKKLDSFDGISLVGTRQISALEKAHEALNLASENLNMLELFSLNVSDAIEAISDIVDPPIYDELLDIIFGTFCLGK